MMEQLQRALEPIRRKIRLMAGRAVLSLLKNVVEVQVNLLDGEPKNAELFQQYGFRSMPLPGAEGLQLSGNGNRDHTLIFCMDDRRYQINLLAEEGEVSMYTDEGDYFVFRRGRMAEINTHQLLINAQTSVEINTATFAVNATASADINTAALTMEATSGAIIDTPTLGSTGDIVDNCNVPGAQPIKHMRDVHNTHEHPDPQGGTVGLPTVLM
jgi:phage baseplate assembly protein V